MESITTLTPQQLRRAASVKERMDALQVELNRLLRTPAPAAVATGAAPRRTQISAAGIARIRAAQRARWAAFRRDDGQARPAPKRKISAAGRAKLAARARERWARAKAAGRTSL